MNPHRMNNLLRVLPTLLLSVQATPCPPRTPRRRIATPSIPAAPRGHDGGFARDLSQGGALPAKYPPDVKERGSRRRRTTTSSARRPVRWPRSPRFRQEMPRASSLRRPRTGRIFGAHVASTEGGDLRLLALGDSIVNDTMRSGWVALLQEAYPKAPIQATVYVRGGGGCQH